MLSLADNPPETNIDLDGGISNPHLAWTVAVTFENMERKVALAIIAASAANAANRIGIDVNGDSKYTGVKSLYYFLPYQARRTPSRNTILVPLFKNYIFLAVRVGTSPRKEPSLALQRAKDAAKGISKNKDGHYIRGTSRVLTFLPIHDQKRARAELAYVADTAQNLRGILTIPKAEGVLRKGQPVYFRDGHLKGQLAHVDRYQANHVIVDTEVMRQPWSIPVSQDELTLRKPLSDQEEDEVGTSPLVDLPSL